MICGKFSALALRRELIVTNRRGNIAHEPAISFKYIKSDSYKLAFSVRKKVGCSVKRNWIKRRIREIVRKINLEKVCAKPFYCIIIVKIEALSYSFDELEHEINQIFYKINKQLSA